MARHPHIGAWARSGSCWQETWKAGGAVEERKTMMLDTCSTCAHFHRFAGEARGECRRFPPTVFVGGYNKWPQISAHDGCGEWTEGDPIIKEKRNPETPGHAIKLARTEKGKK